MAIAQPYREEIASSISTKYPHNPPKLVGFLANSDPAAKKYAEWTGRACTEDKIQYELREVDSMDLEKALHEANADPTVHGIIIYYPVFGAEPSFYGGSMDDYLRDTIAPEKDVEGLCHLYRSNLYRDIRFMDGDKRLKCVLPCTPLAVVKAIEAQGLYDSNFPVGRRLQGKVVTVVNRCAGWWETVRCTCPLLHNKPNKPNILNHHAGARLLDAPWRRCSQTTAPPCTQSTSTRCTR